MRLIAYYLLLCAVVLLAFTRGRRDERFAALTCVAGTALTVTITHLFSDRFHRFEAAAFSIDLLVLAAFLYIALRSDRFWPLWVAGLQLTATTVHLLKILDPDLMAYVFAAALAFWSYPILLLIAVGAWRTRLIDRLRAAEPLPGTG